VSDVFPVLVATRWVHFACVFVLFGGSLYWIYAGRDRWSAGRAGLPRARAATMRLLRVAGPLAALSGVLWLAGTIANMADGFGSLRDLDTLRLFFLETQFGPVSLARLALLALAGIVALVAPPRRATFAVLALLGAVLLASQALLGHAAEGGFGRHGALMIAAYGVHVLAAGAWVGGLAPLVFALRERRWDAGAAHAILSRYSTMASVAVVLIVATGIANAGFRVADSFSILVHTAYGDVLAIKIVLVCAMLALAGFNRFVAMPRLRRRGASSAGQRASVAIELGFGVLVLGVAAVLGITPPPQ
jgi:putative copper resistance protein D